MTWSDKVIEPRYVTFKEAVESKRPFRHKTSCGRPYWFLYDTASGKVYPEKGNPNDVSAQNSMLRTVDTLFPVWEIKPETGPITWYRPFMWHKTKKRYIEGREWMREHERVLIQKNPQVVIIRWEEKEMVDVDL